MVQEMDDGGIWREVEREGCERERSDAGRA
jgi:hypothetical protein